jgi:hypothetical protein
MSVLTHQLSMLSSSDPAEREAAVTFSRYLEQGPSQLELDTRSERSLVLVMDYTLERVFM